MHPTITILLTLCACLASAASSYHIVDSFDTTNFFDGFSFFNGSDPTNGYVAYASPSKANTSSLAGYAPSAHSQDGAIYMGIDSKTVNPAGGRDSVRLESLKDYTKGLFIADITHMPGSACGVWPAFWTFGEPWPTMGEIDILEGISQQNNNSITLHTSAGCNMASTGSAPAAQLQLSDCMGEANTGCSIHSNVDNSFGTGFNAIGGGVYTMEWTSQYIAVHFFPRNAIPADITSGSPDPTTWGAPMAKFVGASCDIDTYFQKHKIIFNTTFCGDWAGKKWDETASCAALAPTCNDYVGKHPEAFTEAFWLINSVKVYQVAMTAGKRGMGFEG